MRYLKYRPDIDGLRAIAVAIVVAFHTGVPGFTGGFVGVDVFFVISGFLITGLLLRRAARHRLDLALSFLCAPRAPAPASLGARPRRDAGARFCVAACPLPASSRSSRSRRSPRHFRLPTSSSGWHSNYFSGQADLMPLLHTWSLSVEEQYYLVWPTLLIALMLVVAQALEHLHAAAG